MITKDKEILGVNMVQSLLHIASEKKFSKGDIIFKEGDKDAYFYIVLSGEIEITKKTTENKEKAISHLKTGEILGEGVLSGTIVKPTTARALTAVTLMLIKKDDFDLLLEENTEIGISFLISVIGSVNDRLNETNNKLLTLYEINSLIEKCGDDIIKLSSSLITKLVVISKSEDGAIFLKNQFESFYRRLNTTNEKIDDLLFMDIDRTESSIQKIGSKQYMIVALKDLGYLVLSRNESSSIYDDDNLRLIGFIAEQIAAAIRTSLRNAEGKARNKLHQKRITL